MNGGVEGKIVAVSDSLTNERPDNWLAMVQARSPRIRTISNAHGGWTTKSFFKHKFRDIAFRNIPPDASVVILLLGSNNLFEAGGGSDAALAEAVEGVYRLFERIRGLAPGARFLLAAPPTVVVSREAQRTPKAPRRIDKQSPLYLERLSRAYERLARCLGMAYVNLYPLLGEEDFADAAHPNEAGNRKIADAMWEGLCDSLAIERRSFYDALNRVRESG